MPAVSSRRRATLAVGATRPPAHLVLVPQHAAPDTAQPTGDARQAFCAKLRAARERRGIPLSTIAAATKVGASHLAALERNDLSRWPAGIYRRAWIRSYAAAVGLPVEATLDEFLVVFDPTPPSPAAEAEPTDVVDTPLRLTFAPTDLPASRSIRDLRSHAIEIAVAIVLAIVVAWVTGGGAWVAIGVLALCAYAPVVGTIKRATSRRLRT